MKTKEISKTKLTTITITKIALFVACLCASAPIAIPLGFTPASLTLQTLIVNMVAMILTPMESFLTLFIYVLIGFIGLPVFPGGAVGPAKLFGPTGGYMYAFILAAPAMSWLKIYVQKLTDKFIKKTTASKIIAYAATAIVIGMTIIYLLGSIQMKLLMGITWNEVFIMAVAPFIPLDIVKCICAAMISVPIQGALKRYAK